MRNPAFSPQPQQTGQDCSRGSGLPGGRGRCRICRARRLSEDGSGGQADGTRSRLHDPGPFHPDMP